MEIMQFFYERDLRFWEPKHDAVNIPEEINCTGSAASCAQRPDNEALYVSFRAFLLSFYNITIYSTGKKLFYNSLKHKTRMNFNKDIAGLSGYCMMCSRGKSLRNTRPLCFDCQKFVLQRARK